MAKPNPPEEPRFAGNLSELARLIGCDRATLRKYLDQPGSPGRTAAGKFSVERWRAYVELRKGLHGESADPITAGLKRQQLRLKNTLLELRNEIARGERVQVDAITARITGAVMAAKTVLYSMPPSLAPQVVGVSVPEAERRIRESIEEALEHLAGEIHTQGYS